METNGSLVNGNGKYFTILNPPADSEAANRRITENDRLIPALKEQISALSRQMVWSEQVDKYRTTVKRMEIESEFLRKWRDKKYQSNGHSPSKPQNGHQPKQVLQHELLGNGNGDVDKILTDRRKWTNEKSRIEAILRNGRRNGQRPEDKPRLIAEIKECERKIRECKNVLDGFGIRRPHRNDLPSSLLAQFVSKKYMSMPIEDLENRLDLVKSKLNMTGPEISAWLYVHLRDGKPITIDDEATFNLIGEYLAISSTLAHRKHRK